MIFAQLCNLAHHESSSGNGKVVPSVLKPKLLFKMVANIENLADSEIHADEYFNKLLNYYQNSSSDIN